MRFATQTRVLRAPPKLVKSPKTGKTRIVLITNPCCLGRGTTESDQQIFLPIKSHTLGTPGSSPDPAQIRPQRRRADPSAHETNPAARSSNGGDERRDQTKHGSGLKGSDETRDRSGVGRRGTGRYLTRRAVRATRTTEGAATAVEANPRSASRIRFGCGGVRRAGQGRAGEGRLG